jgi:hypothetical protein
MLAEIFVLQVEAQVRASPFSDRNVRDPRFVPTSLAPPTVPADDPRMDKPLDRLAERILA